MKKILSLALALVLTLSLAACGADSSTSSDTSKQDESGDSSISSDISSQDDSGASVKSDGYEKFSQLEIGMTESEVNAILGEPTSIDKAYYYYNVTVNGKDLELNVWINTVSGLVTFFQGDFVKNEYRAEFSDSKTDLSTVDGLENGEINTYDACVSAFKTPGFLMDKNEDGETRYLWVDSSDGYMTVSFKADATVKSYSGVC